MHASRKTGLTTADKRRFNFTDSSGTWQINKAAGLDQAELVRPRVVLARLSRHWQK
jgi:hypothetical protein